MVTITQLVAALQKVNQIAGDIPVVVKHVEQDAETALLHFGLDLDPASGSTGSKLILTHGPAPAAPAAPDPAPASPAGEAPAPVGTGA